MTLDEIREQIDAVDRQMKPLFLSRMACARHVAEAKAISGGDVYVGEREKSIIQRRTEGIEEFRDEYEAFLLHLMSVSRRFQYGLLTGMQNQVIKEALEKAELNENQVHQQVEIAFQCSQADTKLNLCLEMAKLNGIQVTELKVHSEAMIQKVVMVLDGNLSNVQMRQLLCQIGKETDQFEIVSLR